ncbi:MAG: cytochrome P450 [Sinobacteraceae bacterium]|nr:cytochrome P450 [Nevskiaceae bacterium]
MNAIVPEEIDISTLEFWKNSWDDRDEIFKYLRNNDPVSWHRAPDALAPGLENSQGFWAIAKHADIQEVSRQADKFSSAEGVFMDDFPQLESMLSFIVTDAPRHTELRGIVSSAFTPRNIRKMQDQIREVVYEVVNDMISLGEGDLCQLLTKEVPGRVFSRFFGITDPKRRQFVMDMAEQLGAWGDPEYSHVGTPLDVFATASKALSGTALEIARERHGQESDDLLTWIVNARYEGQHMTDDEVGVFFALLAGAANDTTRHAMAHAIVTLQKHPDQRKFLFEDFEGRADIAINELLRWQPPLMHFRRTATQDYVLRGKTIKKGDKVVMWYSSGNRDEEVFDNPYTLDLQRNPNPHLAFGGGGAHLCLGSALGKSILKSQLREVYSRMPDIKVGEPTYMLSNFMNGVMKLPGKWTPEKQN